MASVYTHKRSGGKLSVSHGEKSFLYIEIEDYHGRSTGNFIIDTNDKVETFELIMRKCRAMSISVECLYFFLFECMEMEKI